MSHSINQEELLPTLEESLDFLVALELDVSSVPAWQTDTSSDDSDSRRRHTAAPLVKRTNRKVPQPNIREELTVLRATVAELEQTLSQLRPDLSRVPERELALAVWQDVAIRQKEHRQIAEEENGRLRELLEQQTEVATRLRQLLRKRKTPVVLSTLQMTKRTHTTNGLSQLAVVNALRMSILQLYGHVDAILCNPRFQNDPTKPARSIQLQTSGSGVPCIEVVESRVLPFHYRRTADAWWQLSRRREVETLDWQTHTEEFPTTSDDVLIKIFGGVFRSPRMSEDIDATSVRQRFEEPNRVVFVSHMMIEPKSLADVPTQGLVMRSQSWDVVERGPNNSTLLRTYIRSSAKVLRDSPDRQLILNAAAASMQSTAKLFLDADVRHLENCLHSSTTTRH